MQILLATTNRQALSAFSDSLEAKDITVSWVASYYGVLSRIRDKSFDLVVMDQHLIDSEGLDCLHEIVAVAPLQNTAAMSPLPKKEFHEKTEGLGVLMQLPPTPQKVDADKLLDHLLKITGMLQKTETSPS